MLQAFLSPLGVLPGWQGLPLRVSQIWAPLYVSPP